MTSVDLVEAAFAKRPTERVPVHHRGFSNRAARHILGRECALGYGHLRWMEAAAYWEGRHDEFVEQAFSDAIEIAEVTGQDFIRPSYWGISGPPTSKVDDYTYLFEASDSPGGGTVLRYDPETELSSIDPIEPRPVTMDTLKEHVRAFERFADAYEPTEDKFAPYFRAARLLEGKRVVSAGGVGVGLPISESPLWLEAMILEPGMIRDYLAAMVVRNRKTVDFFVARGMRYFLGGGDFASNQGPLYGPRQFRELMLPAHQATTEACHRAGAWQVFASDGNLWPVARELFDESGIDGLFEIDRLAGMDLDRLRTEHPHLTLFGNLASWTLARGTPEDVRHEVESCMASARRHGGIIVGVSNAVQPETPPENIDALLEAIDDLR